MARYLDLALTALADERAISATSCGESGISGESPPLTWRELGLCSDCGGDPVHLSLIDACMAYCQNCSPRRSVRLLRIDEFCDLCRALVYVFSEDGVAACRQHYSASR
jgi:hypothetical protein